MVPVSRGHEQRVAVFQDDFLAFRQAQRRVFGQVQLILLLVEIVFEVHHAQHFPGFAVKFVLFLEREEQDPFSAGELGMDDM